MHLRFDVNFTRLNGFFRRAATSNLASWLLLCAMFWIVAAASFAGFVGKFGLRDTSQRFGIEFMLDATAQKPFVYRQLAPLLANLADQLTPERVKEYVTTKLKPEDTFALTTSLRKPELRFRYLVIYYLAFFSLFLSLFLLRRILLDFGIGSIAAIIAPTVFVLAFPYLQTEGGYFYDSIELMFLSLTFMLARRARILLLTTLVLPATLNKETFFFFLPTLYPLFRHRLSQRLAVIATMLAMLAAGVINVLLKLVFYSSARGGAAEFHLFRNIKEYFSWTYVQFEATYGIVGPRGAFFGTIAVITIIVLRGWAYCPSEVQRHLLIAAAINFLLCLAFSFVGELRNLSFLFVGFVILIAVAIDRGSSRK